MGNQAAFDWYRILDRSNPPLTAEEVDACVALLSRGGAVKPQFAREELPEAFARVVALYEGAIVAVGAIKRARPKYAQKVSRSSGYPVSGTMRELGYIAVSPQHRGHRLSSRIVDKLLERTVEPLFATTDKVEMKTLLANRKFMRQGREWDGEVGCIEMCPSRA
jgi:GNAT superfamily N-acetyltransferase